MDNKQSAGTKTEGLEQRQKAPLATPTDMKAAATRATASMIELWVDEAERRTWFLFEASRQGAAPA